MDGVFTLLVRVTAGPLEVDGARVMKLLPGPVSWLGSGAVKGSSKYLEACTTSVSNGTNADDRHALYHACIPAPFIRMRMCMQGLTHSLSSVGGSISNFISAEQLRQVIVSSEGLLRLDGEKVW